MYNVLMNLNSKSVFDVHEYSQCKIWYMYVRQLKKTDPCHISTRKQMKEEIRPKNKQKQPVYATMSGKRKSFLLSLLVWCIYHTFLQSLLQHAECLNTKFYFRKFTNKNVINKWALNKSVRGGKG